MKLPLLLIFLCTAATWAEPKPKPLTGITRAEAFFTETIPVLSLKDATFEQALGKLRDAWKRRYPEETFPLGTTDYIGPDGYRATDPARITFDLKNASFREAARLIGQFSGRELKQHSELFQLEKHDWIEEDWVTQEHEMTPRALAALHLKPTSSSADLRGAFEHFGVKFEDWMRLGLIRSGNTLIVLSYRSQQDQIAGILFLLRQGFEIRK